MTEWMTAKESAKYIRISYRVFLEYIQEGRIKSAKRDSRFLIKKQWLDEYMESIVYVPKPDGGHEFPEKPNED